jgi:Ca-activated chloride channel homolog
MKVLLIHAMLCLVAWLPFQNPTFRAGIDTVSVSATVRNRDGRLVTNLTRDAFEILDDGRVVPVELFSRASRPIAVALMLDMSGSMISRFLRMRELASAFVDALGPDDVACIGTFGTEIWTSPHVTGDKATLKRVLRDELWPGGGTPLWFAIEAGMQAIISRQSRRVVLVMTDGAPGGYAGDRDAAQRSMFRGAFMVYGVALSTAGIASPLRDLAEDTGGGVAAFTSGDDPALGMTAIATELRHEYWLGFTPTANDGKTHSLKVRMKDRRLIAHAPSTYDAPRRFR